MPGDLVLGKEALDGGMPRRWLPRDTDPADEFAHPIADRRDIL